MGTTIEAIYDDIGGFSVAQCIIISFIFYNFLGASWSMIQMAFAVKVPDWTCVANEFGDLQQLGTEFYSNVTQVYSNGSEFSEKCSVNGSVCINYEFSGAKTTIVNEWNLVCDYEWIPSVVISVQMGGVLVGAALSGQTSERWGRRKSIAVVTVWHICSNVLAVFSNSYQMFMACRFLIGIGIGGTYTISFPYAMEFLPLKSRGRVAILPFWTLGVAIFVCVAYFIPHWRYLHLGCAIFCLPGVTLWFFVPESVRWLTVNGRLDEAMAALARMACWNGKPLPPDARSTLEAIYSSRKTCSNAAKQYSFIDLFRGRYFLKCTLIMCFMWITLSLISYGISFGVHGLAGNLYLNIVLTNCVEIPGLLPVLWLMDRAGFGRKCATVVTFSIICITTVVVLIINIQDHGDNDRAVFWFAMITKLCIDNVWNVIQAWVSELYPTVTRALGYSIATTSARVGGMLAPFLVDLKKRVVLTYLIISSLSLGVVLLCMLLPETRLCVLKDSIGFSSAAANCEEGVVETIIVGTNDEDDDEDDAHERNGWRKQNGAEKSEEKTVLDPAV
ncbi:hypothetical protein PoB_007061800 [Plakobranchus ocellatus]|uniref:Major facilitator superfamily (MFS) profile domain-containing protein n=1 Tax=Plakobranchus ocellatus TaxID=259542 RepID=A0AAV4DIR7_9GAST|nr:hypothetical protein PoB_007061800 [Plakobranchus ocellatus]